MYRIVNSRMVHKLTETVASLQDEIIRLNNENLQLRSSLANHSASPLSCTGWEEVDELLKEAERLSKELRMIQIDAAEILK